MPDVASPTLHSSCTTLFSGLTNLQLNIAYPATGAQKLVEIDDDRKLRVLYDKRISQEVAGDSLGDEFKGYVFKIAGGNDKQGFPMKQGVLTANRVSLLLSKGQSCYRQRRSGERKRKSVRGCIVASDIAALALVVVKKGDEEIPGLVPSVPARFARCLYVPFPFPFNVLHTRTTEANNLAGFDKGGRCSQICHSS